MAAPSPLHWLMKSEPSECGIDDLMAAPKRQVAWIGVRNHQAKNFMRDSMRVGDDVLFYHSSCAEPGIAGLAKVASKAYPDPTQFDPSSPYHDASADPKSPRWMLVDVKGVRKTPLLSLQRMRLEPSLAGMVVLQKGSRLSITPVSDEHWLALMSLLA